MRVGLPVGNHRTSSLAVRERKCPCEERAGRESRCKSVAQDELRRLSLSRHSVVWHHEAGSVHDAKKGARRRQPSRVREGLLVGRAELVAIVHSLRKFDVATTRRTKMFTKSVKSIAVLLLSHALMTPVFGQRHSSKGSGPYYGGGHHTKSHGGTYAGSTNSHHKGGHYRNQRTN